MRKHWKKLLIAGAVIAVAALNVKTVLDDNQSSELLQTSLATIADSNGDSEGGDEAIYNREEEKCTIEGNGKIEVFGKGVIEIKGHLTFDGKVVCSANGESVCHTIDCRDLYFWVN